GALLDSRLLAEVYLELKGGKQFSMNLAKNNREINEKEKKKTNNQKNIIGFNPSEEDVELHRKMVGEIKQ